MFKLKILIKNIKNIFKDAPELRTILFFTFIFALTAYPFLYQPPSYAWIGLTRAELGELPVKGSQHVTVELKTAPVIIYNKLYLPADFVAMASGISQDKIYSDPENFLLVIYDIQHSRIIAIDAKNKKVLINKREYNLLDEIVIKNDTILVSNIWLSKLFYVDISVNGRKITISPR
ncbi:hypothetical protein M2349_000289 [Caldanaerobacter subterraneus subsp. tengcongensis MB4]|uniref:Copper amine oxidase-like N-terminal domain-containing protein n=1 Tax=Caldanaerobacter subterraneus subsp. tengcongensis (strain DSM 15242 / JCM 11007 / NBRC 100824 / MB4) TaxID=273068 RepID=Q8R8C4_CALS4|nr:hypothetical protein [Caldanaerobacter subterraneus]AAM25256.1 hypothetical protein TTE2083 [Caldanaerobacter subterraneus subsp. tengcongensis MB4]MCS3915148.1 hypothetical protein [Caldanaerobacter subterraneus subsp. tengcongensis MB4]